ncbi:MAG: undecaprenyl-diphosphate phosphatase, partial [Pseudomonadota bacterium]|nr:undecaprenyl-diphosphate phosphatase [Pseudomonadota bacterium]
MGMTQLIVLAVVQGLSEFLPISSSGHLVLVPVIFNWVDQGLVFDVAVHFGSLVAVCLYFRHDILALLHGVGDIVAGKVRSDDALMTF